MRIFYLKNTQTVMSHLLDNAPFWEKKNQKLEVKVGSGESSSSISSYYANGQ